MARKMARVFLKPAGERYYDFGVADDATMPFVLMGARGEGGMSGAQVFVPMDMIHHLVLVDIDANVPNLTVFPGGKPN